MSYRFVCFLLIFKRAGQIFPSGRLPNFQKTVDFLLVKGKKFCPPNRSPTDAAKKFVFSFEQSDKVPKSVHLYFGQITVDTWYNESNPWRKGARTWRQNTSFWRTGSGRI
nr:hypothetical protein [uncultured Oscillibacter sp.]